MTVWPKIKVIISRNKTDDNFAMKQRREGGNIINNDDEQEMSATEEGICKNSRVRCEGVVSKPASPAIVDVTRRSTLSVRGSNVVSAGIASEESHVKNRLCYRAVTTLTLVERKEKYRALTCRP